MFDEDCGVRGAGQREAERELLAARIEVIGGQLVRKTSGRDDGGALAFGEERIARVFDADLPQLDSFRGQDAVVEVLERREFEMQPGGREGENCAMQLGALIVVKVVEEGQL